MLVNSLKHLNNEQNKTMMAHYVKVEFYLSIVKLCHYEEQNDEIIQYRVIPNLFRNLFIFFIYLIILQHFFDRKETLHKETPDLNFIHSSFVIILHRVSELVNLQIFLIC